MSTRYFPVEYAGYWHIQDSPHYGGTDILNAEDVGEEKAEKNATLIADLLNREVKKDWESCRCDIDEHYCFVHQKWGTIKPDETSGELFKRIIK